MVMPLPSKQESRVRFPPPAPLSHDGSAQTRAATRNIATRNTRHYDNVSDAPAIFENDTLQQPAGYDVGMQA